MHKFLAIALLLFAGKCASAQKKFNVVCRDFTFEQDVSSKGKLIRNIFEVSLSANNFPFHVLEREKMDKVFEALQEEKNLVKDYSNEWNKKLQVAGIDYLIVGDLTENISRDNFDLVINFIKITGEDITQKLPLLLTFSRKEIGDKDAIKKKIDTELKAFVTDHFIQTGDQGSLFTAPKIYDELKKRDSVIDILNQSVVQLEANQAAKDKEINSLNNKVSAIMDYSHVARLDIYGLEIRYGGPLTGWQTPLYRLMENILEQKENQILVRFTDSSLYYAKQVVKQYPKFPFGHYVLAKLLLNRDNVEGKSHALKAAEIFEITTKIDGHKADHDNAYAELKDNILRPLKLID